MKNLKKTRVRKGIRQAEIAEYLDITRATYSRYENDGINVTTYNLLKISKYLNVSIDYLVGNIDYPLPLDKIDLLNKLSEQDINFILGNSHPFFLERDSQTEKNDKLIEIINSLTVSELRKMIRIIRALNEN